MAPNFSKFTSRTDVKIGLAASAAVSAWIIRNALKSRKPKYVKPGQLSPEERVQYMIKDKDRKGPKAQVDARFFAELKALWHIMVPGLWTKESALMVLIALSLISRTLCDLWFIQHTTLVEGSIITMNLSDFRMLLGKFFMAMPIISIVNNVLKWSIGEVKLRLRTNLSLHLYQQYLKAANLSNNPFDSDDELPIASTSKRKSLSKLKKSKSQQSDTESEPDPPVKRKKALSKKPVKVALRPSWDSEHEEVVQKLEPLKNFITKKIASGFSTQRKQEQLITEGDYYLELRIYNASEASKISPGNRWRHALFTYKSCMDTNSEVWQAANRLVAAAKEDFKGVKPTLYPA